MRVERLLGAGAGSRLTHRIAAHFKARDNSGGDLRKLVWDRDVGLAVRRSLEGGAGLDGTASASIGWRWWDDVVPRVKGMLMTLSSRGARVTVSLFGPRNQLMRECKSSTQPRLKAALRRSFVPMPDGSAGLTELWEIFSPARESSVTHWRCGGLREVAKLAAWGFAMERGCHQWPAGEE